MGHGEIKLCVCVIVLDGGGGERDGGKMIFQTTHPLMFNGTTQIKFGIFFTSSSFMISSMKSVELFL